MASPSRRPTTSLRRELTLSIALLFVGATLVAVVALAAALPLLDSPTTAVLFLGLILGADLVILYLFLRSLLGRRLLGPLERIGASAARIAAGEYDHRIAAEEGEELDRLVRSLNQMAERLIEHQGLLAENVRSLDQTNRELVETTEELVQAARLASVGTLAAGVAHEVGNPLGAIMTSLDLARNRHRAGGDVEEALRSAAEEARRIDRIVRGILEFARPATEGGEIPATDVGRVVRRATTLLEDRGGLEGVSVQLEVDDDVPPVLARPQHLEQVLMNLLMNGVRALREAETEPVLAIRVWAAPARPSLLLPRREDDPPDVDYTHRRLLPALLKGTAVSRVAGGTPDVLIRIEDNGPGIPDQALAHLFDPFFTTRQPGEGTGMGLSVTARIVHELGGVVEASNREEGGARFTVRLPGTHLASSGGEEA